MTTPTTPEPMTAERLEEIRRDWSWLWTTEPDGSSAHNLLREFVTSHDALTARIAELEQTQIGLTEDRAYWKDKAETAWRKAADEPEARFDLSITATMLRNQAKELWPDTNEQGQVHFGRAIMESAAESIEAYAPHNAELRSELAAARKPPEDGEVAGLLSQLDEWSFLEDSDACVEAAYELFEQSHTIITRLSAALKEAEETIRRYKMPMFSEAEMVGDIRRALQQKDTA